MSWSYHQHADYPSYVYAYIDIEHPVVAWNAYRGVISSAVAERKTEGTPVSMMFAGLALANDIIRLQNEIFIESIRQEYFKSCISRLSGMYFFEDSKAARSARNWRNHFTQEYLAELYILDGAEVSKHDSNWITYAPRDNDGKLFPRSIKNIYKYWEGIASPDKAPVWELIINGRAVILGTELRKKAYDVIVKHDPKALCLLEVGRIAAEVGSDLGNTKAFAARSADGILNISFYIDMRDANDPDTLKRMSEYTGPRNHKDSAVGDEIYVPDTREYACRFPTLDYDSAKIISNIHTVE